MFFLFRHIELGGRGEKISVKRSGVTKRYISQLNLIEKISKAKIVQVITHRELPAGNDDVRVNAM